MKNTFKSELLSCLCLIAIIIAFAFGVVGCVNGCSSREWNNGICPKCNEHYDLRGVGRYIKYYVCPECHAEVERM